METGQGERPPIAAFFDVSFRGAKLGQRFEAADAVHFQVVFLNANVSHFDRIEKIVPVVALDADVRLVVHMNDELFRAGLQILCQTDERGKCDDAPQFFGLKVVQVDVGDDKVAILAPVVGVPFANFARHEDDLLLRVLELGENGGLGAPSEQVFVMT